MATAAAYKMLFATAASRVGRCLGLIRKPAPPNYWTSKCTAWPTPLRHLEIERKFDPGPSLRRMLKYNSMSPYRLRWYFPDGTSLTPPKFFRQADKIIQDHYFDLDDKLKEAGLWLRRRNERYTGQFTAGEMYVANEKDFFHERKPSIQLELKIRRGGDYLTSEMEEVIGDEAVKARLKQLMPNVRFEDLKEDVALETDREMWQAEKMTGGFDIKIVIDMIHLVSGNQGEGSHQGEGFHHSVGEVEFTKEVSDEDFEAERQLLRTELDLFLDKYSYYFPTDSPLLKGKLSAYYEWKHEVANGRSGWPYNRY